MLIDTRTLLAWYQTGMFPMADKRGEISLYSPDPRAIIDLDRFHVSRSLRQTIRSQKFHIRFNTAFVEVIRKCADRDDTWISEDLVTAYCHLHRTGSAHSVEVWREGTLSGGLYGVAIHGAFFGESMFHLETDASKVALVALVERMRNQGMTLLDTQFITTHLARFGAVEIPREEYLRRLAQAVALNVRFL